MSNSGGCGRPPTINSSGSRTTYDRWQGWKKPRKSPDKSMKKKMLIKSFEIVLKIIIENHVFTFNKKLYKQKKGDAIGVSLAGDIANLFMIWWDRELKKRLSDHNFPLKFYARYIDDGNIAIKRLLTMRAQVRMTKTTMEKVKEIANSILRVSLLKLIIHQTMKTTDYLF